MKKSGGDPGSAKTTRSPQGPSADADRRKPDPISEWMKQLDAELKKQTRASAPSIRAWLKNDKELNLAEYMMFLTEMARAEEASPAAKYVEQLLPVLLTAQTAIKRARKVRSQLDAQYSVARPANHLDPLLAEGEEALAKEIAAIRHTSQQEFHLTTPGKPGKRASNRLSNLKLLVLRLGVGATFSEIAAASPSGAGKKMGELDWEVLRQRVRRLKRQLVLSGRWVLRSP